MFATSCSRCKMIRVYIAVAFGLVLMIGLRPAQAQAVAGMVPTPLTLAIMGMVFGSTAFAVRYRSFRRAEAQRVEG